MLELKSWWPQAEGLELGQKRRRPHDCGEGRVLIVSRDNKGYSAWCHRCNDGGNQPPPQESLTDKLARLAAMRKGDELLGRQTNNGCLPVPLVQRLSEWPEGARLWLYKAGIGAAEAGILGITYHKESDRVILPFGDYWQGRAYQKGRMPKYLGPTPKPPRLCMRWGSSTVPTLTEDMLSAMKVGLVAEGWCVAGTYVSDHMIAELMKRGPKVNVWLDPDPAGRKGAAKICKQLRAYGLEVRNILSQRDPKLHTRDEIKEILCH